MTEPPTTDGRRLWILVVGTVVLAVALVLVAPLVSLGWPELALIVSVPLSAALPAVGFYVWARRRGDLP